MAQVQAKLTKLEQCIIDQIISHANSINMVFLAKKLYKKLEAWNSEIS